MQILKLKITTPNSIDLLKKVFEVWCLIKGIKITNTEALVMAYYMKYGVRITSKEMILNSKILGSVGSLENLTSRLRGKGLIVYDRDALPVVNPEIGFTPENKMGIIIQLENV